MLLQHTVEQLVETRSRGGGVSLGVLCRSRCVSPVVAECSVIVHITTAGSIVLALLVLALLVLHEGGQGKAHLSALLDAMLRQHNQWLHPTLTSRRVEDAPLGQMLSITRGKGKR